MNFNKDEFYFLVQELSRIRIKKGLTTSGVASVCGVTSQTVRNFENGDCFNIEVLLYYIHLGLQEDNDLFTMLIDNCFYKED